MDETCSVCGSTNICLTAPCCDRTPGAMRCYQCVRAGRTAPPPVEVDDDYVNENCPDRCSAIHTIPTPSGRRSSVEFRCPETRTSYGWCSACGGWQPEIYPVRLGGEWLCYPNMHGYYSCNDCGDWVDDDSDCGCERENDPYIRDSSRRGERVLTCSVCNTTNTIFNELTETFHCECTAAPLRERKVPLKVIAA